MQFLCINLGPCARVIKRDFEHTVTKTKGIMCSSDNKVFGHIITKNITMPVIE